MTTVAPFGGPFDRLQIRTYLELIHELACGLDGCLTVSTLEDNPTSPSSTGAKMQTFDFKIGDVDAMHDFIMGKERHPWLNIYMPLVVFRPNLDVRRSKGSEADVVKVLGLVIDHDADKGEKADPVLPADLVLQTSALNTQHFYLFDAALDPAVAKEIAAHLIAASGGDRTAKDISHIWRVPGTLNWPDAKKAARRGLDPQPVRIVSPDLSDPDVRLTRTDPFELQAASRKRSPPPPLRLVPPVKTPVRAVDQCMERLLLGFRKLVALGVPAGHRSETFDSVVQHMHVRGLTRDEIVAVLEAYPEGIAEKFRGRLEAAVDAIYKNHDLAQRPLDKDAPPPRKRELVPIAAFLEGFTPPDYVVDGILQRGYLYSLTARTGHGKTAISLYLAQAVARGEPIRDREVEQGSVVLLAGENPTDIMARLHVLGTALEFDPAALPVHVLEGVTNREGEGLKARMPNVLLDAHQIPNLSLVIVDTAQAYYAGDDMNNNAQQAEYARLLRQLTLLPGKPAVVINCHPVKYAARDNLIPQGGGSYLNEMDGNITLWLDALNQATLHWQGKFRGPDFDPLSFKLVAASAPHLVDTKGRPLSSVYAYPISEQEREATEHNREKDEELVLAAIGHSKSKSLAAIAGDCGFVLKSGDPNKMKVGRLCSRMGEDKLVALVRGKWRLTAKGKREIGLAGGDDD